MRPYIALLKARFSILFQYRAAALAGLATQLFWGFIKSMIITAFFGAAMAAQPMTLEQALSFIWLGQAILHLLPWNMDKEDEEKVRSGSVVFELVRPLNLYWHWFARAMAIRLVPTLIRMIPLMFMALLFFELSPPESVAAGAAFAVSLIFSLLLSSSITTLVTISLFWTISGEGIKRLMPHIVVFLSGMIVPLPLFPGWSQPFLNLQPFRGVIDIPCRLYTGLIPADQCLPYFLFQATWTAIFIGVGLHLMGRALKRLVVQGG